MTLLHSGRRTGLHFRARTRRRLLIEIMERREVLSTITVTSLADSGPGSLRDAIMAANVDSSADTIQFAPSVEGQITLLSELPGLEGNLTLNGPGASVLNVARSSDPSTPGFRIFEIADGASVGLNGLTISNGSANGGGILNSGTLTITDSVVRNNQAVSSGGGIQNQGNLTIENSQVRDNQAIIGGGGIYSAGNSLIVENCEITGNVTQGTGGGLMNYNATSIKDSLISGNSAVNGSAGGIASGGSCTIAGCTIANNSTGLLGGGIENGGNLLLINSTLFGNSALDGGGMVADGPTTVIDSTITANRSQYSGIYVRSMLTLQTTILDNPIGQNLVLAKDPGLPQGQLTSLGHNLFSDTPDAPLDPTDLVNTDPLLAPLANYGGPTATMALLPGSPAIDAGATVSGITTDQRGVPRPQGSAPDIGAFESQGFLFVISGGDGQSATVGTTFANPLIVTLSTPDGHPLAGAPVAFSVPTSGASAMLSDSTVTTDAIGQASVTATANDQLGSYSISTQTNGLTGPDFALTNTPAPPPPVPPTPTVLAVERLGVHMQPTFVVVRFSAAMDAGRAGNLANYRLVSAGRDGKFGTKDDQTIRLRGVRYDDTTQSIRLAPSVRLPLRSTYQLTINGTPPDGLVSSEGIYLGGEGASQPGTSFVATINRGSLVRPTLDRVAKREQLRAQFRMRHPHNPAIANA